MISDDGHGAPEDSIIKRLQKVISQIKGAPAAKTKPHSKFQ